MSSPFVIPSPNEDPVERRRLLNVLAQRRYRERKRARLTSTQAGEFQAGSQSVTNSFVTLGSDLQLTAHLESSEDSSLNVLLAQPGQEAANPREPVPSSEGVDDFLLAPDELEVQNVLSENPMTIANNPSSRSNLDTTWWSLSPQPLAVGESGGGSTAQIESLVAPYIALTSQSPFADETFITFPGLTLMRAHAEIARSIKRATGIDFDVFDPLARSPFYSSTNASSAANIISPTETAVSQRILSNLSSTATAPLRTPLPKNWHPTPSQKSVDHHPVLDLLPWPTVREGILQMLSQPPDFRPHKIRLACDSRQAIVQQIMFAIKDAGGGLRVWGSDPFNAENWEAGEVFFKDFWWAFDRDTVERSNKLREGRGANRLRL